MEIQIVFFKEQLNLEGKDVCIQDCPPKSPSFLDDFLLKLSPSDAKFNSAHDAIS
jgi:hypothetical protein